MACNTDNPSNCEAPPQGGAEQFSPARLLVPVRSSSDDASDRERSGRSGAGGVPYYQAEGVTLYHGDCRELLPKLSGSAIITDPPFKLSQSYSANVDADNLDAVASLIDSARMMRAALKPGAVAAVFYDNRIMPFALNAFARAEWSYLRFLPFYRRWGNAHKMNGWMSTTDPILLFGVPGAVPEFFGDWRHDCYIKDRPESEDHGHPAQKPIWILEHIASHICPRGGTVIDPYAGSGSTLVAAKKAGRTVIGIEKEEWACEIVARRLDKTARVEQTAQAELLLGGGGAERLGEQTCAAEKGTNDQAQRPGDQNA